MAIGSGTHFGGPVYGDDRSAGGLCDDVPIEIQNKRFRAVQFYDFMNGADHINATNWLLTIITSGTAAVVTGAGSSVLRLAATTDAQGVGSFQALTGSMTISTAAQLDGASARTISCAARFSHSDFSIANWFFGLAPIDVTLMATTGDLLAIGGDNMLGFHHIVDATAQGGVTGPDGNDVRLVSAGTAVANYETTMLSAGNAGPVAVPADAAIDGVMREYGVRITGNRNIEWYVNGRLVHRRRTSAALTGSLTPSFALIANGTLDNYDIDYVWQCATR